MKRTVSIVAAFLALAACGKSDDRPAGGAASGETGDAAGSLKVAAAASLARAFEELGAAYTAKTGREVVVTPGSSGKHAAMIAEGAPFDVFASADASWIDEVIQEQAAVADTRTEYAYGRVVVWTEKDPITEVAAVIDAAYVKIALASPEHAPYGRAAKQALQKLGIWDQIESRVVYGSNVRQAFQYAQTGNVEAAFTALSLVLGQPGHYLLIDDALHAPLGQEAIALRGSERPQAARDFLAFLTSDAGHRILRKYGLVRKGETLEVGAPQ